MNEFVLRTRNLTKTFKNATVLDNVNINIRKGSIYGLIGLNGAGKTTLIRLITGLSVNKSGSIELFGENEERKFNSLRSRLGCLIETPAMYPNKTGYENLEIDRIQKGIPGTNCIEKVLKMVDLEEAKGKTVRNYSLGMKQRLGIAMALLGDPEFIILDEPVNGLDPVGIIEVRELLKKLNTEYGVTILISSHILEELHQLSTCYGIIHKGKLIQEITEKELIDRCKKYLHVKVDDPAKASVIINTKLGTSNFEILPNNIIRLYDYLDKSGIVSNALIKGGISVEEINPKGDNLEQYFTKLIGGGDNA